LLFNSAQFLLGFLPAVLLLYYLLPHRAQNVFLVIASCLFYASWDWRFLLPLLVTTSLDYWISLRLERTAHDGTAQSIRKRYLMISVVANLSLLGFFKYFNFFYRLGRRVAAIVRRRHSGAHLRHRAAGCDLVLHLPGTVLHDRRVPR